MADRREGAQKARVAQQHVELAEAFIERRTQAIDAGTVRDVERDEGGVAADLLDAVVEFLEAPHGARDGDHVRAFAGEGERRGRTQPARGAGDESDAVLKSHCCTEKKRHWSGALPAMT